MDQIAPDAKIVVKPFTAEGDDVLCAQCAAKITRHSWAIQVDGRAEHYCINPHGLEFRVLTFSDAPGATTTGPATTQASWFRGYAWRMAVCGVCDAHLGWRFEGGISPQAFYGLIRDALKEG